MFDGFVDIEGDLSGKAILAILGIAVGLIGESLREGNCFSENDFAVDRYDCRDCARLLLFADFVKSAIDDCVEN